jgi:hypothetical protein
MSKAVSCDDRKYWWAFASDDKEVVLHPFNSSQNASDKKERMKQSPLVQSARAFVGVSKGSSTRDSVREWAAARFPGRKIIMMD